MRPGFQFVTGTLRTPAAGALLAAAVVVSIANSASAQRSQAARNFPSVKTPEEKLRALAMLRARFPAIRGGSRTSFRPEQLDTALERAVSEEASVDYAPIVDDETFLRRVSLDLTGQVPTAAEVQAFVANTDRNKRSDRIDELLAGDACARKWARYWRSVVFANSSANRNTINPQAFEDWLFREFKNNTPWDRIVAMMVSASPERDRKRKPQENGWHQNYGPNNFILACERKPEVIASQTARIFMGISIGCAECHDHPFDDWKREQFHEMAAFFARGKYFMTDQYDPTQKTEMEARFLLGEEPPLGLNPDQRRVVGAAYLIYNPDNYWFARAFVNRIWNELLGDGFYAVDSLGPDQEVLHQLLINRLGATFRNNAFDIQWLMRTITNTNAYQREIRTIDDDANLFTAVRPARLRPYEVADSLEQLVGENQGLTRQVRQTFQQDPSIPQRDLEGSIQQALLMMNNPALQNRLAGSQLKRELMQIRNADELIRQAFLGVLARTPTAEETERYARFLSRAENHAAAVDDMLWVLVNSAEFITKR
jgi:hypothetical protein